MVPGSPNTGALLKNGNRLGIASTKDSVGVEAGVLADATLQGLAGPFCGLGITNARDVVVPTEALLPIASATLRPRLVNNAAVGPPLGLPDVSIKIGR